MKYSLGFLLIILICLGGTTTASAQRKQKKKSSNKAKQDDSRLIREFEYAFGEAIRHKLTYDMNGAEAYFRECIKLDPTQPAPYYELANIYHPLNKLQLALENAKIAAEYDPENFWYQMMYIESLQKLDMNKEAAELLDKLSKRYPEKQEIRLRLAMTYFIQGQYEKGITIMNEVEKVVGITPEIIEPKKMAYIRLGKIDKAAAELRKLIDFEPEEVMNYLNLADLYQVNEMTDKALEVYKETLEKFPNDGKVHLAMADHYHKNKDDKKAFDELKLAFKDEELNIDTKVKILLSYYSLINHSPEFKQEAFELNQILIDVHPNEAKSHTIYGDFLYNEKKLEEARKEFTRALELDERPFPIWNQVILIDAELERFDSVLVTCKKAIELFPNQPSLYYYSGIANVQLKNYQAAVDDFESGRKLVVDNDQMLAQFYSSLGEVYNELKQYPESDKSYDASLRIDSNNANTLNNYSYYLSLRNEKLEKAEQMSARSNKLVPNQSSYLDTYAWIMYQLQRYEEAREWIGKALNNGGGNSAEVLEHAGDIYYQLNEKEKALEYWEKAKAGNGEGSPLLEQKIRDQRLYE